MKGGGLIGNVLFKAARLARQGAAGCSATRPTQFGHDRLIDG
jgi:hypothetical protein